MAVALKLTAADFKAMKQEHARRHLISAIQHIKKDYLAGWFHKKLGRVIEKFLADCIAGKSPRLIIEAPPRHGKALSVDEVVPTPDGFKRMSDLRVGDSVFAVDGSITKIVAISEIWKNRKLYKVTTNTGDSVTADAAHEWVVRLDRGHKTTRYRKSGRVDTPQEPKWVTHETEWLANRTSNRRPLVPCACALQLPHADLPIAPYTLGVWLGGGKNDCAFITQGLDDAAFVMGRIADDGFVTRPHSNVLNHGVIGIHTKLRENGLLRNKHVPAQYLRASADQRLALLQGLIDADGHVSPDGQVEFCSTNEQLALAAAELVRSLGVKVSVIHGRATLYGKDCGPKYRVMFYMDGAASIPRKSELCKNGTKQPDHYISFEPAGYGDTVCIEIEHPSHLFLAGVGMLPTCNSEEASRYFPAYALGKYPDLDIIATSYSSDLASSINRDIQRIIDTDEYHELFPGTTLGGRNIRTVADGSYLRNSDVFEIVNHKGVYKSAGVGAGVTGRGARVILVDDPIKDAAEAGSETVRQSIWDWFTSTLYTRLMPGGGIIVIMCMTGDTPVLMADDTEKMLAKIVVGDEIATYENGRISTSTVKHWKNQGRDLTYEIMMTSGKTVRANERHPFLVCRNGRSEWVRLKDLRTGDRLVRVVTNLGNGANGKACSALSTDVMNQSVAKGTAYRTTKKSELKMGSFASVAQTSTELYECATDTALNQMSSTHSSRNKMGAAPSAASRHLRPTVERTGLTSSALTTTTPQERCADFCATIATLPLGMERQNEFCSPLLNTYESTLDEIVSITESGYEDVFDIEVDRTENFIANGLVSHNTRWHMDDLVGRLRENMKKGGEQWQVFSFPAVAEHDEYDENGELLRYEGEALHPERFGIESLARIKKAVGSRVWAALYQQRPSAAEGNIFKRENWKKIRAPRQLTLMTKEERKGYLRELGVERVIQRWDTALGEKKKSDYSACVTLGVAKSRYYVLNVWKAQLPFPDVKDKVSALYDMWSPSKVVVEGGGSASGKATVQTMKRETRVPLFEVPAVLDKVLRAELMSPNHESGLVWMFENEDWTSDFEDQCANFPAIKHDDDVDAFVGALEEATGTPGPMQITDELLAMVGAL
jgi:predicted phage terminase large subunit-like protein